MLEHTKFEVPNDWANTGGPARRYRFRVQFSILGYGQKKTVAVDSEVDIYVSAHIRAPHSQ
jgi:hypothetical protein